MIWKPAGLEFGPDIHKEIKKVDKYHKPGSGDCGETLQSAPLKRVEKRKKKLKKKEEEI